MKPALRATFAVLFALAFLALSGVAYLSYQTTERFLRASREASTSSELLLALERTLSAVRDAETGQRGYLLTGDSSYLTPYWDALGKVSDLRLELRRIVSLRPSQAPRLQAADRHITTKLDELESTIAAFRTQGAEVARARVRAGSGRAAMDSLRAQISSLEHDEAADLATASETLAGRALRVEQAIGALTLGGFLMLAFVGWLFRGYVHQRRRTVEALQHEQQTLDQRVRDRTAELLDTQAKVNQLNTDLAQRLHELEAFYQVIPVGVAVAEDPQAQVIRINPAFAAILGLPSADGVNASKSGPAAAMLPFRIERDGRELAADDLVIQRALRTGEVVDGDEYQIVLADGRRLDMLGYAAPLRDAEGRVRGAVGAFVDITERKRTEEQLRHAQRMQAVGQLAGGVAHDINNVMTSLMGFAEFAQHAIEPGHPARADVEQIIKAALRAATITRQLLAFSRRQRLELRELSLNAVVRDLEPTLRQVLGSSTEVQTRLHAGEPILKGDRAQLEQILINLAANARDAMPLGGRLTIETNVVEFDAAYQRSKRETFVELGTYALIAVTDTGNGMDVETRRRAFEPFFTTKETGRGTGLGLSMVYGIVKQSNGYVWLYSEPGHGTTVKIYLPLLTAGAVAGGESAVAAPALAPGAGAERIVVVEDDDTVRGLVVRALENEGYQVLETRNGREALDVIQAATEPIHLVVCDIVMPEMTGWEFGQAIAQRRPDLRILYMSGYTGDDVVDRGLLGSDADFLAKPFTPREVVGRVRDVLNGR